MLKAQTNSLDRRLHRYADNSKKPWGLERRPRSGPKAYTDPVPPRQHRCKFPQATTTLHPVRVELQTTARRRFPRVQAALLPDVVRVPQRCSRMPAATSKLLSSQNVCGGRVFASDAGSRSWGPAGTLQVGPFGCPGWEGKVDARGWSSGGRGCAVEAGRVERRRDERLEGVKCCVVGYVGGVEVSMVLSPVLGGFCSG